MDRSSEMWYLIDDIDELDSPALVIYPGRVKENIRLLKSMIDEPSRLRPHVKTHKTKEATRLLLEAGITKFKCATISEAEMLAMCQAKDVLLAYQPVGPKVRRLLELILKYPATKFSCITDNISAAREMAAIFADNSVTVPVYIDLNVGMNRTGIVPGKAAVELYQEAEKFDGVIVAGLHAYDGHIRDSDIAIRTEHCDKAFKEVEKLRGQLMEMGYHEPVIIAGGSPTFPIHAKRKNIECSPGTFIYWDTGYSILCPEQPFLPAAVLITRVISLPTPTRLCLDLGHKSVASENEISRRIYFLNASDLKPVSQSEEHLVVEVGENHSYKPGNVLYGIPYHICPTCALYERAFTIENKKVAGEWRMVGRDRRIES